MKKYILLTPGPTPIPPSVLEALARPIIHHRTHEFGEVFDFVAGEMKSILHTENPVVMMTTSGTGAMESAVVNLLSPGDVALVLNSGVFGQRFAKIFKAYGLDPLVLNTELGSAVSPKDLAVFLKAHSGLKAVFIQHTDTSTGILNDLPALSRVIHEFAPEALIVIDAVSSLGAENLEMDAWGLDVVVTASQKGLMNAPGLAFAAVGPRAWKVCETSRLPRFYLDWRTMRASLKDKETPYTPAVPLVVAQAEALRLIKEEGLPNVLKRTSKMAHHARDWAKKRGLSMLAKDPAHILTALYLPKGIDGNKLVNSLREEEGISIAGGQESLKGKIIRVAHMGYISQSDLEAGLDALDKRLFPVNA
jgi:aspartate aminotransferase-like enzyme